MADVYLGPQGSETLLPTITYIGGSPPSLAVTKRKAVEKSEQIDGSVRYNFKASSPFTWPIEWARLTESQFTTVKAILDLKQVLRFQNNWIDATWFDVVVTSYEWSVVLVSLMSSTKLYRLSAVLEECL